MKQNWTRKEFLKTSLLGGGAALIAGHTRIYGATAPVGGSANGDIRIGVAGINQQGASHMRDYLMGKIKGARLVAICDVDEAVLTKRKAECTKEGNNVATYGDVRKMLDSKDVDAVVFAPPNHWHSLMTIWALQAGKDVYIEKPLSHNIWEGRQVVEAAKKYTKNIAYCGTQNRSSEDIIDAMAYVRAGNLGKITWVRGLCYKPRDSIGKTSAPTPPPASINYDLWTGPAALVQPHRNSPKYGPVHYDWHWFWNYGGGDISNQGIHQMDVARWFLGEKGLPPSVMSFGGRFGYQDDAETPNTLVCTYHYKTAPLIFEVRGLPMKAGMRAMDKFKGTDVGVVVQCENGYVTIGSNGGAVVYDNQNKVLQKFAKNTLGTHRQNYIKAIHARKVTNAPVEECFYSTALCHLGNLSYLVGTEKSNKELADAVKNDAATKDSFARVMDHLKANNVDIDATKTVVGPHLKIDASKEMFTGGEKTIIDAANKNPIRKRTGRAPYTVPEFKSATVAAS